MKKTLSFYECEHDGDMEIYESDLRKCGAKILSSRLDFEDEECTIEIEVDNYNEFFKKFKETNAYDFVL